MLVESYNYIFIEPFIPLRIESSRWFHGSILKYEACLFFVTSDLVVFDLQKYKVV